MSTSHYQSQPDYEYIVFILEVAHLRFAGFLSLMASSE